MLNRDDEWYDFFDKYPPKQNKISYGTTAEAESRIMDTKLKAKGSEFNLLVDKNIDLKLKTHLPGKFNVYNAAAAASAAYLLHFDKQDIIRGIGRLESVPGRMQYIDKGQNFNVVIDYAHTPDALKNLLETLAKLTTNRVILVFGACGDRDKTKRPIMGEIAAELANRIVLTDEEPYHEDPAEIRKQIKKGIKNEAMCDEVEDRREGIKKAFTIARKGDTVVITGMGHQEYMKVGSHSIPWNDARVSEELLEELGKSKSQN